MIFALLTTLSYVLQIVWFVFIIMIIMSWLVSFGVVNTRNQVVYMIWRTLNQLTDPILRPIRRILPSMGGLDLSPIVVFIIIFFLQRLIDSYAFSFYGR